MKDDLEQIIKAQAGDREALNYLSAKWYPRLVSMFRSKRLEDADDLAQEVLLAMIQKIDQLKEPAAFGGWLNAIAANKVATRYRKRKELPLEPEMGDVAASGMRSGRTGSPMMSSEFVDDTLVDILRQEDEDMVGVALDKLPDVYACPEYGQEVKDILMDFFFNGKKITDIATERDRPEGTIKRILHIAKEKLADLLPSQAE